jgi:hypothetical protein
MTRYVRIPKFEELTGYTAKAVARKIETGAWAQDRESIDAHLTGIYLLIFRGTNGGSKISLRRRSRTQREDPARYLAA